MKSRLLQTLVSVTLVVFAADCATAGPSVGGSVLISAGESPEAAFVELFPILPDFELGGLHLQGVQRFKPAAAGRPARGGHFQLEAPQRGLYRLVVRMRNHVPVQIGPIALVEDLELAPVILPRDAGTLIEILDPEGSPVGGAWVFAWR